MPTPKAANLKSPGGQKAPGFGLVAAVVYWLLTDEELVIDRFQPDGAVHIQNPYDRDRCQPTLNTREVEALLPTEIAAI